MPSLGCCLTWKFVITSATAGQPLVYVNQRKTTGASQTCIGRAMLGVQHETSHQQPIPNCVRICDGKYHCACELQDFKEVMLMLNSQGASLLLSYSEDMSKQVCRCSMWCHTMHALHTQVVPTQLICSAGGEGGVDIRRKGGVRKPYT